ncbi:MAG: hypothetical protein Q9166_005497 [cf. Caloplaca sp. 2 TL-2023]
MLARWSSCCLLYALLSNPFNVTLLTSQILTAPAIWGPSAGLRTVVGVIKLFRSASFHLLQQLEPSQNSKIYEVTSTLRPDEWMNAVVKGIEGASPRSRQVMVLSGLLQGLQSRDNHGLSTTLQDNLIHSVNLSLRSDPRRTAVTDRGLIVAISQVFDLLDTPARLAVHHDLLLPMLIQAVFFSEDGIHQGYFLGTIDVDVVEAVGKKFDWSAKSTSYLQLQTMASSPLVADMGRLSRLVAFSTEHANSTITLARLLQDLFEVSRSLCIQWRQNKLSEVDASQDTMFLTDEAIKNTLPLLWRVLRSSMFAVVVILASYTGRLLSDNLLARDDAPSSAIQMLKILRNLSFISSRLGTGALSQYSFVYLAAVDIISQYPIFAEVLLSEIGPTEAGAIAQHPLDRRLDIYFLDTAEHFAPVLDTKVANGLLTTAASPYLDFNDDQRSPEAFEAAHSVMLAVLSAPQNVDLATQHLEQYINLLFRVCHPKSAISSVM